MERKGTLVMAEQSMEITVRTALSRQFGAAIAMLENALVACPRPPWIPPEFPAFWHLAYHTLFWLDLYLAGAPEGDFAPPAPFIWTEGDPAVSPARPYTKEELLTYLAALRRTCHAALSALTEERAHQAVSHYGWTRGEAVSYLEVQMHNLRHVQEHAAQLSLFLGQHGIPDAALAWVARDGCPGQRLSACGVANPPGGPDIPEHASSQSRLSAMTLCVKHHMMRAGDARSQEGR
jgi:hypothetical protein